MKDIKKEFKIGDRVEHQSFGTGTVICLLGGHTTVVFDNELRDACKDKIWYDKSSNGLTVITSNLSKIEEVSEQTDLVRLNSRFTTNQEAIMDNQIKQHGMELQTLIIGTELLELSLSVNDVFKNYNIKNLYDLTDKMAAAYIALEELKKMWQIDDETIDDLIDKKMGEIKKKMEEQ